ncbi:hypothetical protein chiPu_0032458, partial [Chiloscyllium punctatum]|nr:hypothetical protein [Chiloscyllium punctatum]
SLWEWSSWLEEAARAQFSRRSGPEWSGRGRGQGQAVGARRSREGPGGSGREKRTEGRGGRDRRGEPEAAALGARQAHGASRCTCDARSRELSEEAEPEQPPLPEGWRPPSGCTSCGCCTVPR